MVKRNFQKWMSCLLYLGNTLRPWWAGNFHLSYLVADFPTVHSKE